MLPSRVCARVRSALTTPLISTVRSRSSTAITALQNSSRAPTLADITPESAAGFNEKQKEFREGLVAAQKRKEKQESASFRLV